VNGSVKRKPWLHPHRNPWRAKAKGKRVLSVPLWLWCDDTSGNQSKKWNKHNSFLFTLAGLPRHQQQSAFNIHFLATSNIASPLEMLEGIKNELRCVLNIITDLSFLKLLVVQLEKVVSKHGTVVYAKMSCLYHGYTVFLVIIPCRASFARILG
jgi:hypothetical protein